MSSPPNTTFRTHPCRLLGQTCLLFIGACTAVASKPIPTQAMHTSAREHQWDRYNPDAAAACLQRARQLIRDHTFAFRVMSSALDRPVLGSRECRSMNAEQPFAAFEGWWQGRWSDVEVAHLWLTVEPGVQLVLLSDNGVLSRGINLALDTQEICGLVVTAQGEERVHEGRFFEASAERPAYLKWLTPGRNYTEQVSCDNGERRYDIVEEILDDTGPRPGNVARYAPPGVDCEDDLGLVSRGTGP